MRLAIFKKKKKKTDEDEQGAVGVSVNGEPDPDANGEAPAEDNGEPKAEGNGEPKPEGSGEPKAEGNGEPKTEGNGEPEAKGEEEAEQTDEKSKKKKKAGRRFKRDPRKAHSFFRHAETVAETRNYNYAIDCYINGLRHDPDNMIKHEALREIALRRKVSGEGPAKFKERVVKGRGGDKVDKLLHAELLWSKDPLNLGRMIEVMEKAVDADQAEEDLNIGEIVHWIGVMLLEKGETEKPPTKAETLKVRDLFSKVGAWQESVNATRAALQLDPNDHELVEELKDLEANLAIQKGGYGGGTRDAVQDIELQETLDAGDRISKTASASDQIISRARDELAEDPENENLKLKLIKALAEKNDEKAEDEAVVMLEQLYEEAKHYRHKVAIGDIRMKQANRRLRAARDAAKADKDDKQALARYKELTKERLDFELAEFADRVKHYPTDMKWRYELGRRQFTLKQHDEAMANFQAAKVDPKYRPASSCYLGRCYIIQEWHDEAIDTLRDGLEQLPDQESTTAIEMKWYLCAALVKSAQENNSVELAKEAQKVASQILQVDVNYRDIKDRLDQIRALVKKLQQNAQ